MECRLHRSLVAGDFGCKGPLCVPDFIFPQHGALYSLCACLCRASTCACAIAVVYAHGRGCSAGSCSFTLVRHNARTCPDYLDLQVRKKSSRVPFAFQHCMYFAGLRGAVAFALAMRNAVGEQNQMILSTTLVIAFITVLFFGGGTVSVLQFFKIRCV